MFDNSEKLWKSLVAGPLGQHDSQLSTFVKSSLVTWAQDLVLWLQPGKPALES